MIIWPGLRRVVSAVQRLFNSASVSLPLTHTAIPTRGSITPAFTRATTATFTDWEGVLRTVPSGCARFQGGRMVQNLWTTSSATLANGANKSLTLAAGDYTFSMGAGTGTATFSGTGGATGTLVASASGRVEVTKTITAGTFVVTASVADLVDLQVEYVTGQADQTASEYVSVGVLSAPYHGAGADGVEFFNTDRDGALLSPQPAYLAEGARTQILATADIRDMTTAAWTLGATMTRAQTSIGADGAANSATRLTGGAVAATNTCYTTITAAASSRTYSALVKRITGTGPVRIVQTGTETDISSQLATTGYALVQLTASVLNVAVGFKIDTNGDAIDVDFNQFEAGASASSRIASAVTRAADVLTYTGGDLITVLNAGNYTTYIECNILGVVNNAIEQHAISTNVRYLNDLRAKDGYGDGGVYGVGVGQLYVPGGWGAAIAHKTAFSVSASGTPTVARNGTLLGSGSAGSTTAASSLIIGADYQSLLQLQGTIRNVRIWNRALSASEMQAITA